VKNVTAEVRESKYGDEVAPMLIVCIDGREVVRHFVSAADAECLRAWLDAQRNAARRADEYRQTLEFLQTTFVGFATALAEALKEQP